jgi:DNA (cytosine-5)-methyltransferase 1
VSKPSYITVTDQFCGAGGSSLGAAAAGAEVKMALNHWKLAIETHSSNFPNTDHDCTDISACDPRRYPSTDILITSPECTSHSLAKGKMRKWQGQMEMFGRVQIDPAEERSRATMWDVPRFAEFHKYNLIIVENVVDARRWVLFDSWLHAMHALGYEHQIVYLNSFVCHPTPQSRDRMYVVFWRTGNRAPNLDIRPRARCLACARDIEAIQSWKNPSKRWGKYKASYVYRCPRCSAQVTPYYYPAASAIDWTLPAERIGDRKRPLTERTLRRIRIGLEKYGQQPWLSSVNYFRPDHAAHELYPTQTSGNQYGLVAPPMLVDFVHSHHDTSKVRSADDLMPTQIANVTHGVVVPPFLVDMSYTHGHDDRARPVDQPWATQTGSNNMALVTPPFLAMINQSGDRVRSVDDLYPTQTGSLEAGLIVPYYSNSEPQSTADPLGTVTTVDRHAIITHPFIVGYYTRHTEEGAINSVDEPLPTMAAQPRHYLATPGETIKVDDCRFRMLQPHEIGRAMAFPDTYTVLGNSRDRVKQFGNAVTPPVMELLIQRGVESLNGRVV